MQSIVSQSCTLYPTSEIADEDRRLDQETMRLHISIDPPAIRTYQCSEFPHPSKVAVALPFVEVTQLIKNFHYTYIERRAACASAMN